MAAMWKTRNKERTTAELAETTHLLSASPDCYDEMLQVLSAYQTVGEHISLNAPKLKLPAIGRWFGR